MFTGKFTTKPVKILLPSEKGGTKREGPLSGPPLFRNRAELNFDWPCFQKQGRKKFDWPCFRRGSDQERGRSSLVSSAP